MSFPLQDLRTKCIKGEVKQQKCCKDNDFASMSTKFMLYFHSNICPKKNRTLQILRNRMYQFQKWKGGTASAGTMLN